MATLRLDLDENQVFEFQWSLDIRTSKQMRIPWHIIEKVISSPQNVSKNSAVALRILKVSHRVALQFYGL